MIQSLFILFAGIATSFFFFPFQFAFLPGVNTKMLMQLQVSGCSRIVQRECQENFL